MVGSSTSTSDIPVTLPSITIREFHPAYDLRALCVIGNLLFTVESVSYCRCEATGDFPQVVHGSVVVGGPRAFDYLRSLVDTKIGGTLPRGGANEAFTALARGVLHDAELWSLYANDSHFSTVVRPAMLCAMKAPLSYFSVPSLRKE